MTKAKYSYEDITSESLKNNLLNRLTERYTFEGKENPKEEALVKLNKLLPKMSIVKWRRMNAIYMKLIDEHRVKLGLEKIHNIEGL